MSTDAANIQALLDRITEGRASDDDLRRLKALLLGEHIYQSATGSNIAQAVDHSNATVNVTNNYYSQQSLTSLTPLQIYEACKKLADSSKLSIGLESTIIRKGVIAELDDFILSSSRYAAILGGSGVGKTVVMAQAVQHFLNLRWAVLLMNGQTFSLNYVAERIGQDGLEEVGSFSWRQVLIEPWTASFTHSVNGFLLFIYALDKAELPKLIYELEVFNNAIAEYHRSTSKLLSCAEILCGGGLSIAYLSLPASNYKVRSCFIED